MIADNFVWYLVLLVQHQYKYTIRTHSQRAAPSSQQDGVRSKNGILGEGTLLNARVASGSSNVRANSKPTRLKISIQKSIRISSSSSSTEVYYLYYNKSLHLRAVLVLVPGTSTWLEPVCRPTAAAQLVFISSCLCTHRSLRVAASVCLSLVVLYVCMGSLPGGRPSQRRRLTLSSRLELTSECV